MLSKEAEFEQRISKATDPLKECVKYVCAGNYIDFGAVKNVNEKTFEKIWKKAADEKVSEEECAHISKTIKRQRSWFSIL